MGARSARLYLYLYIYMLKCSGPPADVTPRRAADGWTPPRRAADRRALHYNTDGHTFLRCRFGEGRIRREPQRGGRGDVSTFTFHLLIVRCCAVPAPAPHCTALRATVSIKSSMWSYSRARTAPELQRHRTGTGTQRMITDIAHACTRYPHPCCTAQHPWALRFTKALQYTALRRARTVSLCR
jgi:hypothetical protein